MFENIIEKTVIDSNTVLLNIPEEDYFLSYEAVTRDAAEDITRNYFLMRNRDGIPMVRDIEFDEPKHRVIITLEVRENLESHKTGYAVPDHLNITRNNEAD